MADQDHLSDQEFDNIIDELVRERELGLGDDNQSDISVMSSVSSVHTSELSSREATGGFSSSESDVVLSDEEWTDTVEDSDLEDFVSFVGPRKPLGHEAKPVEYFLCIN